MELADVLRRALDGLCATGAPEVRENGEWLAGLEGVRYEVSTQGQAALLHMWSSEQSLVRRVLRVADESENRVLLEVSRLGVFAARAAGICCRRRAAPNAPRGSRTIFRAPAPDSN